MFIKIISMDQVGAKVHQFENFCFIFSYSPLDLMLTKM